MRVVSLFEQNIEADIYGRMFRDLLLLLLYPLTAQLHAEEFRYHHQEVTGLVNVVTDTKGTTTLIKFHPASDPVALRLLDALLDKRIHGTSKPERVHGTEYNQHLVFEGEFVSEVKRTESAANTASPEPYRDFKLQDVKVAFPLHQVVMFPGGNEIDGPFLIHVHLSFETLLPSGITHHQKKVDLAKHAIDKTSP